jgi:hypothetical protein
MSSKSAAPEPEIIISFVTRRLSAPETWLRAPELSPSLDPDTSSKAPYGGSVHFHLQVWYRVEREPDMS